MKKIIIAAVAVAAFAFSAQASSKTHKLFIPAIIQASYNEYFPDATVPSWSVDNQYLKAVFVQNNVSTNAFFNMDGELVGTTQAASFTDLPLKAQQHISSKYKDYKVTETLYFIDNDLDNESDIFRVPDSEANYFVSLVNGNKELILQVNKDGDTGFYEEKTL